jgi:hypothetical protein
MNAFGAHQALGKTTAAQRRADRLRPPFAVGGRCTRRWFGAGGSLFLFQAGAQFAAGLRASCSCIAQRYALPLDALGRLQQVDQTTALLTIL